MSLTNEKESILAKATESELEFPEIDKNAESYYVLYEDSKHMNEIVMEYDSSIPVLRKNILNMWKDTSSEPFTGDVLSAVFKCKDNEDSVLEAIELFNYMM